MASSTLPRPVTLTSILTLNRREGLHLYPILQIAEKQNIRSFSQRQLRSVTDQFLKEIREKDLFTEDLNLPIELSLRGTIEECQRNGTLKKTSGAYEVQRGFIHNGYLTVQQLFSPEELSRLESCAKNLCRAYLTA